MEDINNLSAEDMKKLYDEDCSLCSSLGSELLSEAASLLLEDPDKLAELLSPEDIAEIEELRKQIDMQVDIDELNVGTQSLKAAEKGK